IDFLSPTVQQSLIVFNHIIEFAVCLTFRINPGWLVSTKNDNETEKIKWS
ncbi:unnamed protein product, partial [Arabidopsis halleri]